MGTRVTKYRKNNRKRAKMIASGDPGIPGDPGYPGDLVHGLQLGTSPTRAGGQDDVSSNKLPQTKEYQTLGKKR